MWKAFTSLTKSTILYVPKNIDKQQPCCFCKPHWVHGMSTTRQQKTCLPFLMKLASSGQINHRWNMVYQITCISAIYSVNSDPSLMTPLFCRPTFWSNNHAHAASTCTNITYCANMRYEAQCWMTHMCILQVVAVLLNGEPPALL